MAESQNNAALAVEEIRALQKQMEEMQKRLEMLCAEQSTDAEDGDELLAENAGAAFDSADAQLCAGQDEPQQNDVTDEQGFSKIGFNASEEALGEKNEPSSSGLENQPGDTSVVEPVSVPEEAGCSASAQNANYVSEQASTYQPPATPVSGYAPQQTQPIASGAPTPPPSYEAATQQQASNQQQAYYAHPTGQQAYQSGVAYSNGHGASSQAPYNPYGQTVYQQPVVRTKDHVAAGLLGIFLGSLGVHKFYLGYNTAGFIMLGVAILGGLLSFGIATSIVWLIGLIEGIIYLVKNQAEFEQAYVFSKREWF